MILSFTVIYIFSLIYSSIGKEINQPFLVSYKKNWNKFLLKSIIDYLRKNEKEALIFAYIVFLIVGLFAFLLYILVSKHPSAKTFGYPWGIEATVFILPLLFGFKPNSEVKENSLIIISKVYRLVRIIIIPICILLVFVKLAYPTIKEITYSNLVEMCLFTIVTLVLLAIIMFTIYVLIPHFSSKIIVKTLKFIFFRILKYDRKDPTSGLFRHLGYLVGIFSLLRFILSWFFPEW